MPDPGRPGNESQGVLTHMENIQKVGEFLTFCIATGSAIVGFIKSTGGVVQFLVEVGTYGFACYVSAFIIVPLLFGIVFLLEKVTHRETIDTAIAVITGLGLLGGGALIRFGVFHPEVAQDLDGIGTFFAASVGVIVLCIPLVIMWYLKGSSPATHRQPPTGTPRPPGSGTPGGI